jgi:hypothetical protein
MVEHPEREDCYIARLLVKEVSPLDSKRYFLDVENVHGTDRYAVALLVKGQLQWSRKCELIAKQLFCAKIKKL